MERDASVSAGCAHWLFERFGKTADETTFHICNICGSFASRLKRRDNNHYSAAQDVWICNACSNSTNVTNIRIPYAFKLLLTELKAMSIYPQIKVAENKFSSQLIEE